MMKQLSRKAEYALRAVIFLARQSGNRVPLEKIANNSDIPKKFLEKILKGLANEGVVKVFYGSKGGYMLAKIPSEITFKQIIEAVEGPIVVNICTSASPEECTILDQCSMHSVWKEVQSATDTILSKTTLADVVTIPMSV